MCSGQNMYSGLFYFYHPNETNKHLMSFDTKVRRQEGRKRKQSSHRPKALLVQNCYPHKQSWKCIFFPGCHWWQHEKAVPREQKTLNNGRGCAKKIGPSGLPTTWWHPRHWIQSSSRYICCLQFFRFSYTTRCMFETVHIVLCQHGNVASTSLWRRLIMLCFIVARKKQH